MGVKAPPKYSVGGRLERLVMREFHNGMTVRELRELVKDWPDTNKYGEECEVWIKTGRNLSSPVTTVAPLNLREDDNGKVSADLLFESTAIDARLREND